MIHISGTVCYILSSTGKRGAREVWGPTLVVRCETMSTYLFPLHNIYVLPYVKSELFVL